MKPCQERTVAHLGPSWLLVYQEPIVTIAIAPVGSDDCYFMSYVDDFFPSVSCFAQIRR